MDARSMQHLAAHSTRGGTRPPPVGDDADGVEYNVVIQLQPHSQTQTDVTALIKNPKTGTVLAQWGNPGSSWGPYPLADASPALAALLKAISDAIQAISDFGNAQAPSS